MTYSQWETLKGSKKPFEKSHQQRSTARMTFGMGFEKDGEREALRACEKVVMLEDQGTERGVSRGNGCQ